VITTKQLSTSFYCCHAKTIWKIVHIATGLAHLDLLHTGLGLAHRYWEGGQKKLVYVVAVAII